MTRLRPDADGANVVLVGTFNPAILQPLWLSSQGLVREEAAKNAAVNLIHKDVAIFTIDQMALQVTPDKFQASTTDPAHWPLLRDLVLGVFTALEHTPVTRMGLNRHMHFAAPTESRWHEIGNILAPKEPWGQVLGDHPGLLSVTIQGLRPESACDALNVKVEPSKKIEQGVFVSTNEHYNAAATDALPSLLGILKDSWDEAQNYALEIAKHILTHQLQKR